MQSYQPWDDSWREQVVYIMVPYEVELPVVMPSDFTYPIFLGAIEKGVSGDDFWRAIAGTMVYVIGHEPNHPQVPGFIFWLNSYNPAIVREIIYDGADQASKGNLEAAIWLFQAAVLLNPQIAETHFDLGLAFYQMGLALAGSNKEQEAIGCFQQAVQYLENSVALEPQFSLAYYNLGFIYKQMGLKNESQKYLEKAILMGLDR